MTKLNIILIATTILGSVLLSSCYKRLIIDTDGGPDDAMAILLALSAFQLGDSDYEIVGITCTYGNAVEENVLNNTLKTLTIADATHIPVYSGAKKPLIKEYEAPVWFGHDGFGDFRMNKKITATVNSTYKAYEILIKEASDYPGQLTILALGPLTNIARAISEDSNFIANVKKIYIMGGRMTGSKPDRNFGLDPESDLIVLQSNGGSLKTLFTSDANAESRIPLEWRTSVLGTIDSTFMNFLKKAEQVSIDSITKDNDDALLKNTPVWPWGPSDVKTAAAMMWPNLITERENYCALPKIKGETKGILDISDPTKCLNGKNVEIIKQFDVEEFKEKLLKYLNNQ